MNRRPTYRKDVTDAEVALANAATIEDLMAHVEDCKPTPPDGSEEAKSKKKANADDLTDSRRRYLQSILDRPLLSTVARRDYLETTTYKANKDKKELLEAGLISELVLNFGKESQGVVKVARLTSAGHRALGKRPPPKSKYPMSPEHEFWEYVLCDWWRSQGEDARIEYELNGKRADVALIRKTGPVAAEVEMTAKNIVPNVRRDLAAGFVKVIVACGDARICKIGQERLNAILSDEDLKNVQVKTLAEFSIVRELLGKSRRHDNTSTKPIKGETVSVPAVRHGNG